MTETVLAFSFSTEETHGYQLTCNHVIDARAQIKNIPYNLGQIIKSTFTSDALFIFQLMQNKKKFYVKYATMK